MKKNQEFNTCTFPEFKDDRGSLVVWENSDLPFRPARTFCISNVPTGKVRASHSVSSALMITAINGSVCVVLNRSERIFLNNKCKGLLIPEGTFIELMDFSESASILVFAEKPYKATTYYEK